MALDAAPRAQTERTPGDFQRHPTTGAPYVNHPTELTKGGKPKRVMYGRPSSFGSPLENPYNLLKWKERQLLIGINALRIDWAAGLDVDDRDSLDRIAAEAHEAAGSSLSAERGTFVHKLTEIADRGGAPTTMLKSEGVALDIPEPLQCRIVEQWRAFRRALGLSTVAVEATLVNDELRCAGTVDRLDLATRPIETPFGTITREQVVIGDIKTGKVVDSVKNAVQLVVYADGVPYDTEADARGTWEHPPHPDVALIYHYNLSAALDGELVEWQAIPVDLKIARVGALLCRECVDFDRRSDYCGAPLVVSPPARGDDEAAVPLQPATVEPGDLTPPPAPVANTERDELRQRRIRMEANARETGWHAEFLAAWTRQGITAESTNAEIRAALDAIEPPFDPDPAPPHGIARPPVDHVEPEQTIHAAIVEELLEQIRAHDSVAVVNAWLGQAHAAGCSFDPRQRRTVRLYEITRAAHHLARMTDGDDELARMLLAAIIADQSVIQPAFVVGVTLAALTIEEATTVSEICQRLLELDRDITPADVVAMLAAA
jgi:hypothetical protein